MRRRRRAGFQVVRALLIAGTHRLLPAGWWGPGDAICLVLPPLSTVGDLAQRIWASMPMGILAGQSVNA
jgi:hypothetical protein